MKQRAYQVLSRLGVPGTLRWAGRGRVTMLMYHGFTERSRSGSLLNSQGLHLHVDVFREHLEILRDHYTVISLDEALDGLEGKGAIPPDAAVLTMDDGYRSNYRLAFPLLREFLMPATVFLATDFVDARKYLWTDRVEYAIDHAHPERLGGLARDSRAPEAGEPHRAALLLQTKNRLKRVAQEDRDRLVEEIEGQLGRALSADADVAPEYQPLEWGEVEEMLVSGLVSIGSHSASHFTLGRCRDDRIVEEVRSARAIIEDRTSRPCPLFCYPNGQPGDFDERTRRAVIEAGHRCALTTVVGFNRPGDDCYTLRRVGVMDGDTREDFVMALCGVGRWVSKIGEVVRGLRGGR